MLEPHKFKEGPLLDPEREAAKELVAEPPEPLDVDRVALVYEVGEKGKPLVEPQGPLSG